METILFREKFADWPDTSRLIQCKNPEDVRETKSDFANLNPYDAKLLVPASTVPVDLVLEGSHVGRGNRWELDMDGFIKVQNIDTVKVVVWHVLEYEHYLVEDHSYGQFHEGDTYVIRWQYAISSAGARNLKGQASKHSQQGRERYAYFFWQGKSSTINEKGASALMTVELDEERGPQIRVDEGKEPPCFLNLFTGWMMIHIGKREEEDTNTQGHWRFYCLRNEYENEMCLIEVPAECDSLRSVSSFVLLNVKTGSLTVWHGSKSPEHTRKLVVKAAENLKERCPMEVGLHSGTSISISEVDEGQEKTAFWRAVSVRMGDRSAYNSLLNRGPLGELLQWSDLITGLYVLGHQLTITSEAEQLASILSRLPAANSPCQSRKDLPVDIIYTDIVGLKQFKKYVKNGYGKFSCLLRIVDSFGTEPAFNLRSFAKQRKKLTSWGGQDLQPQQFFTMFPHSPDNSFMGFVVEQHLDSSLSSNITRHNTAVVYGKSTYMWKGKEAYLNTVNRSEVEIHATVYTDNDTKSPENVPSYVINHGILDGEHLHKLLRQAKIFLGLGFPYEGPAPLEAIANGAVYINPKFTTPHNRNTNSFFKGKPTERMLASQHPYAEQFIGEPYVYTINIDDADEVRTTVQKILDANHEMMELVANSKGMSNDELAAKKHDLKRQQKRQLKEFNRLTNQLVEQAEKDIIPEVEVQQTHMRLEMKEKQMSELSDAMTSYSPSEELNRKYKEEAKLAALEAQKFRDEVLRRIQEEIERKKKEEKDKEEEKKRQMEEHYKKLAADLEADQHREEQRLNEREAEKQRLKEKQLQERRRNEEEEIRKSNLSESEKERLLHEHSDNMEKLEQNLNEEQNRSKSALAAKLEARKKRRQGTEHAKLSKQMQLDADAEQKKHLAQKQQEEALMGEQAMVGKTETSNVLIGEIPQGVTPEIELPTTKTGVKLTGNLEQDWVNLLMASPLFQKINDLENMIDNADLSGQGQPSRVKGADYSTPYIDVKDAQWSCKGDLSPADANQISPSQFVVYRFGIFLIKLLHQSIGTPEVSLLLASNLPPNNYTHNAFRNSVYYEHARNILFVRKERVESIGEFAVLILHAVSHIKCGEMTDDGNALFLRQFYKCLKVICQDMFFSRSHGSTVAQSLIGSPAPNSRPALEKALAPFSRKEPDRENVIGELVDMKVDGPTRADFSSQRLSQRLIGYENMASNARLRQYLGSKGGFVASSDFVSSRMAELRGSKTTAAPKPSPQKRMPPPIHVPRDIVDTQLVELQSKCDKLNEELSDTLKMEEGLREAVRQLETDPTEVNDLQAASQKLESELLRKNELLLRISSTEADIMKKEKELKLKRK